MTKKSQSNNNVDILEAVLNYFCVPIFQNLYMFVNNT